ncbi:ArnT family glycosyltransferase, partial [Arachidicoccus sp.]|uniref:ArnT family glycosyltransferase n=1 Tax=Arachidicoccus sp. TaxID=1872624 RepID=UPI003D24A2A3
MTHNRSFSQKLFLLIICATVIRCLVAYSLNLGNDEVYYFTYALQPDWNHFDHPPLVGIFIRFFTVNLHYSNQFTMRLTAIIGAGFNTWLIARCGYLLRNERAGFIAAILYTTSIYTSIISGIFILPDSPQVVFWMMALWVLIKLIQTPQHKNVNGWLLLFGLLVGITTMCKIHGVFLWIGFGLYIILHDKKWLFNPYLYFSILITLVCISPIVIWNYYNDFATWHFNSNRVSIAHASFNLDAFITTTIGQIAYNNPINVTLSFIAVSAFIKGKKFMQRDLGKLLMYCALPIIVITTGLSLLRDTLPHWSGPGFMTLLLPTAIFVENKITEVNKIFYKKILDFNMGFIAIVLITGLFVVQLYPGTMSQKVAPEIGANDVTLDMYGWQTLKPIFEKIRN